MTDAETVRVVDADAHLTERHDLWTKRAPAAYKDRVPRVEEVDGRPTWLLDGTPFGWAGAGGCVDPAGVKHPYLESQRAWTIDQVHPAAYDPAERLRVLDECGIHAQVLYPNSIGIGGQEMTKTAGDATLRLLCVEIYNDAMAEIQRESGNRLLPMPILPAWDVAVSAREAERIAGLGLRGIVMTPDTQDLGAPDLANRAWDAVWEVCADRGLPVHFHISASLSDSAFFGHHFWPSQDERVKPPLGGTMLFLGNARVIMNTIMAGMLDRHPGLKMVSVESGIGWIPFTLETLHHEVLENATRDVEWFDKTPLEYFREHWYGTFWYEEAGGDLQHLVDAVGDGNILFATDFPHPTCLYPKPLEEVAAKMATLRPESRRRIMGDNAATLYRLD
jgi:predicted TIM-barrel fold metal-dependent hydrolase